MLPISLARHRSPAPIIQHPVWLYLRFTPSLRDIEELLAERGVDVSYETVRRCVLKFGPAIDRKLRVVRPNPRPRWHLDQMVVTMGGNKPYLWRAVADEGEGLDLVVQRRWDKGVALKLMRKHLKKPQMSAERLTTDKRRSDGAAFGELRPNAAHKQSLCKNNRTENSPQPVVASGPKRRGANVLQTLGGLGHGGRRLPASDV